MQAADPALLEGLRLLVWGVLDLAPALERLLFGIADRLPVDVYLPDGVRPLVAEGQTAIAGETVIADLRTGVKELTFRVG